MEAKTSITLLLGVPVRKRKVDRALRMFSDMWLQKEDGKPV